MPQDKNCDYVYTGTGLTDEEIPLGKKLFDQYITQFNHLRNVSNCRLLEELVWKEMLQDRYKKQVDTISKVKNKDGNPTTINGSMQNSIDNGIDQIIKLKEKLGMFEEQKAQEGFEYIAQVEAKAAQYRKEHPLQFKVTSPYDGRIFFLKRRTTDYEEFISPFYAEDKVLNNRPLWKLYKDGKITSDDVAAVLGVSSDYLAWLAEHVYGEKQKATEETQESAPDILPAP